MSDRFSTIDWDDLRFFLAVARSGSLRGGAEAMHANHATVSRRLATLEAGIDARLFDRTRGGLVLTELGERLLPHALKVEDEIVSASRLIAGRDSRPTGTIHVSMAPALSISSIGDDLAAFTEAFADIELHLQVTNAFADLARREADVSIRYAYEVTDDVVGRRVQRCAKAVYCSPGYAERVRAEDGGEGLTWIGWGEPDADETAPWIRRSPFPKARLKHRINEAVPQIAMASAGVGLTILPCFLGDRSPGLVRAPCSEPVLDRSLWLLFHNDLRRTARIRAFVDFIVERIRGRKAEFVAGARA
ncbi:LysR family transcriptional regulator [Bauldia sp.]|uniref:LysR family transcriptional regulator n=1 Tax=Bauldia sp. TaxID=2575872 RepID=UPI003BA9C4F0